MLSGLAIVVVIAIAAACGGDDVDTSAFPTPSPAATAPVTVEPSPEAEPPKEFRVAFLNLFSPLTLDANNKVASDTFDERLDLVIREMKGFAPDIIGFNEASVTKEHGSAVVKLARELKMEPLYFRANPWLPGQSKEQSDALVKQVGFEEGELILVRTSRYPVVGDKTQQLVLNPRTTEAGERRVALHVVVKGPGQLGEIDIFIAHFTGGGDSTRRLQVADFAVQIANNRGSGPTIVLSGQSDPGGTSVYDLYSAIELHDVGGKGPLVTCCRESVLGSQPPMKSRSDYLMAARWAPVSFQVIGNTPTIRADGTTLYMSDHNGLAATFAVPEAVAAP